MEIILKKATVCSLHFTPALQQSALYPWSAVRSLQYLFYTDRFVYRVLSIRHSSRYLITAYYPN